MSVFNSKGRLVKSLLKNKDMPSGIHSIRWDGMDENRSRVSGGIYFIRLQCENFQIVKKVTMVK